MRAWISKKGMASDSDMRPMNKGLRGALSIELFKEASAGSSAVNNGSGFFCLVGLSVAHGGHTAAAFSAASGHRLSGPRFKITIFSSVPPHSFDVYKRARRIRSTTLSAAEAAETHTAATIDDMCGSCASSSFTAVRQRR